jgi:hypothetical protein
MGNVTQPVTRQKLAAVFGWACGFGAFANASLPRTYFPGFLQDLRGATASRYRNLAMVEIYV